MVQKSSRLSPFINSGVSDAETFGEYSCGEREKGSIGTPAGEGTREHQ